MPNSKHRKKQLAANRRQLEKARRRLQLQSDRKQVDEQEKENQPLPLSPLSLTPKCSLPLQEQKNHCTDNKLSILQDDTSDNGRGWLSGLYDWCHSGIVQVVIRGTMPIILYGNVFIQSECN